MNGAITCQEGTLVGKLSPVGNLSARISESINLSGVVSVSTLYEEYVGTYSVVPTRATQTLNTDDKHLNGVISVSPIPYYEVSNLQGGTTIIIGGNE